MFSNEGHGLAELAIQPVPFLLDARVSEFLRENPARFEQWLRHQLLVLKVAYRRGTSPAVVVMAATGLHQIADRISDNPSVARAELHLVIADCLLASRMDSSSILLAQEHALRARDGFLAARPADGTGSITLTEGAVAAALVAAVSDKAAGRRDDALRSLRASYTEIDIRTHGRVFGLPLQRQEALILQDTKEFGRLVTHTLLFGRGHPGNYYDVMKRFFEFLLNSGKQRDAAEVEPELKRAFRQARTGLVPIDALSYQKNLAQFAALSGDMALARARLRIAANGARALGLAGQIWQVRDMLRQLDDGADVLRLRPYRAQELQIPEQRTAPPER